MRPSLLNPIKTEQALWLDARNAFKPVYYFAGLHGALAYSLHAYRLSIVFRDLHIKGCCLLLRLNKRLPIQKHTTHTSLKKQCFQGTCTATSGHNTCLCAHKPNVLGSFSGTKPLIFQHRTAATTLSVGLFLCPDPNPKPCLGFLEQC